MSKREEAAANGAKRYVRRDDKRRVTTSVEEGAFLSPAVSRHYAKTGAKPGEGDHVDHHAR